MKLAYFSVTGQNRRFIKKVGLPAYEIDRTNPFHELNEPYILVVPTYDRDITEVADDFIEFKSNQQQLKGVVGSGNLNFGELYVYTAKEIAHRYHIPMLFDFEMNGTPDDVENFKKVVSEIESKTTR